MRAICDPWRPWAVVLMVLAGALFVSVPQGSAASPQPRAIVVDARGGAIPLWPGVTMLTDPSHGLGIADVTARRDEFRVPDTAARNLGPRDEAVWLRVELRLNTPTDTYWWLALRSTPIDEVDVFLLRDGRLISRDFRSQGIAYHSQRTPFRFPAVGLEIGPVGQYEIYIRLRKYLSLALFAPLTLEPLPLLVAEEMSTQAVQGALFAICICLALYGFGAGLLSREPLYGWFGLFALSNAMIPFIYFGFAAQHLWPSLSNPRGDSVLFFLVLMTASGLFFVDRTLEAARASPRMSLAMRGAGVLLMALCAAFAIGVVSPNAMAMVVAVVGPSPFLLALPVALRRAWRGDPVAYWVFAGWLPHAAALAVGFAMHRGWLPWTEVVDHALQAGGLLDLVTWIVVMVIRESAVRREALYARDEHVRLRALAETDGLTGLLNRRGFGARIPRLEAKVRGGGGFALYLLDLDGFKAVNDRHGHETGDMVLKRIAEALTVIARSQDLACRLGGDEFVMVVEGVESEEVANRIAERLHAACIDALAAPGLDPEGLGVTIGYGLAPQDGLTVEALTRHADRAMYAAKRAGKNRVGRGGDRTAATG
ncbi:sensor domain-containing diguanylate cyclase [Zavarzinia compransoris]|uniref:diguanylate cyclase n=1 Tax=Zavarzinia marina TaxID=2911065 RepID=UPI001F246B88|nr:diguanylate cyclase [Zavarzinia marina]MCF4166390.1 sensor domain-containing diguanylate cyclase [Zavarzinia marina]